MWMNSSALLLLLLLKSTTVFVSSFPIQHQRCNWKHETLNRCWRNVQDTIVSSSSSVTSMVRRMSSSTSSPTTTTTTTLQNDDDAVLLDIIGKYVTSTLVQSDKKRDETGFDGASTGWTSWIDTESATQLQEFLNTIEFNKKSNNQQWIRWIRNTPVPTIVDVSTELRNSIRDNSIEYQTMIHNNNNSTGNDEEFQDDSKNEILFLQRIGLRMIVLPSGSTLRQGLQSASGSMIYGILLFGGVTRFRLLGNLAENNNNNNNKKQQQRPRRRVGERTVIVSENAAASSSSKNDDDDASSSWLQYGGPERNYCALDIGPCMILELTVVPTGLTVPLLAENEMDTSTRNTISTNNNDCDMILDQIQWDHSFLTLKKKKQLPVSVNNTTTNSTTRTTMDDTTTNESKKNTGNTALADDVVVTGNDECNSNKSGSTLQLVVGGLQQQIQEIVRRVVDGRSRSEEMETLLQLGLHPIRGLLLYGPPGCGKTHLAREIANILNTDRPPKIIAAPELLDRWVGGTERLVRELFEDAETELHTSTALHVIVVDEIDAVFRIRSASDSASEVTRASAVNQILTKLDGIEPLDNILFIGMTNRRELLDPALLRPGRLEVQIEIPYPDSVGRREILQIHFGPLRRRSRLSVPLCLALDGIGNAAASMEWSASGATTTKASSLRERIKRLFSSSRWKKTNSLGIGSDKIYDLAADRWTGGFSGADLVGLVRSAGSHALARARNQGDGGLENLLITLTDVEHALQEVKT